MRNSQNTAKEGSGDLYKHLTEVFNRILTNHPYDGYDKFEEISMLIKQTKFKIEDPKFDF
jgi:hypothetical protein